MNLKLENLVSLVSGASKGLGFAVAKLLLQEGARVAINSRSKENLAIASKKISDDERCKLLCIQGDITDPEVPTRLVEETINKFERLDLLVTNAGGPPAGSFDNFDDDAWQEALELNLMSHIRLIRQAKQYLQRSKYPSILTITSITVKQPLDNLILSNSVRAAAIGLTKSLANEFGPLGIRVNSILPGWTNTQRVQILLESKAAKNNSTIEEEYKKISDSIPLGRIGTPEEFANVAVFLLSPAASYINGMMLAIDGGLSRGLL
jgi:3-oxoacyl-[acyl-carrier protein] reductase